MKNTGEKTHHVDHTYARHKRFLYCAILSIFALISPLFTAGAQAAFIGQGTQEKSALRTRALSVFVDGKRTNEVAWLRGKTGYVNIEMLQRLDPLLTFSAQGETFTVTLGSVALEFARGSSVIRLNGARLTTSVVAWERPEIGGSSAFTTYVPLDWVRETNFFKTLVDPLTNALMIYRPRQLDPQAVAQTPPPTTTSPLPAPPVPVAEPFRPSPFSPMRIMIDAGHGGQDPGARSVRGRYEKDVNFIISQLVYDLLKQDDRIEPLLMRTTDQYIAPMERAKIANERNVQLFISIHTNAASSSAIRGVETFYWRDDDSARLATIMQQQVLSVMATDDRGVKKASFAVVRETKMPAILLELGFLTNEIEEAKLFDFAIQQQLAQAIVAGIGEYVGFP